MSRRLVAIAVALLCLPATASAEETKANTSIDDYGAYVGNYRLSQQHALGIDKFIMDSGETAMLISDYSSGVVRRLFPVSDTEFVMGAGFNDASDVELAIRFSKAEDGATTGMVLRRADSSERFARRVALKKDEVSFGEADARLAGTLIMPAGGGPHPAVILLHGSGPLTRYSFGPYPHFFTSLGLAVLIYDKRGTGASTGIRFDASSGAAMTSSMYPEQIADDALAALQYLQRREDIDASQIGFWGSSEGGMLATYVAARSKDVAFAINSSGFMGPLWETLRYQSEVALRKGGASEAAVEKELALIEAWLHLGRTGEGVKRFERLRDEIIAANGSWFFQAYANTPEQTRWTWRHLISFDPLPSLAKVTCPVLGVFGELDVTTDAANASENMRRVLSQAGHEDFTIKIFPKGSHSLMEMPSRNRMTPGVFDALGSWLSARVQVAEPRPAR